MELDSPTDLYANDASDTAALRQYLRQYTYIEYTADDWLDMQSHLRTTTSRSTPV